MRSRNLLLLCAVLVIALCGTALAKLADDMTISGNFAKGYTVNNWYLSYVTVSGGVTDYTFNITEGELPPGFFIRQDGSYFYLEGIPDTVGTWAFKLRVTDRRDMYAERELSVTVDGESWKADDMSLSGAFTETGETGTWYESYVDVDGGVSDYTFNISGTLPAGLYIRQYGSRFYLEGVPTQAGDSTFVLKVTDRRNSYAEISNTVSITAGEYTAPTMADDMAITGDFTTNVRVNESYGGYVDLSGYDDSTVWSVVSGTLPPGLSLSNSYLGDGASLSGIPNTGGAYRFTLRAVNSKNKYVERNFIIKVNDTPFEAEDMSIEGDFTTDRRVNESYSSYVSINGTASYWASLSLVSGILPPGLSLRRDAYNDIYLEGIPNTGGTYTFTLRATDSRNAYIDRTFTVKINGTPFETADMSIEGDFDTDRRVNESYSSTVSLSGHVGTAYITVVNGSLPPGLSLRWYYGWNLYGIPNTGGTYTFTLRVTDSRNAYIDRTFTVKINDTPYAASDMSIEGDFDTGKNVNEDYSSTVSLSGHVGTAYITVVNGSLPPGLSLRWYYGWNLYGIPNTPGTYTFTLRATDSRNAYTEREFSITINGESPSDPTTTTDMSLSGIFPDGYTVNNWYSSSVQVSGGTSDYTFKITGGTLPPGFFIRQDGSRFYLEGIPNTAGTYTFKLRVIDQRNTYTEREFTVKINSLHYSTTDMSLGGSFAKGYTVNNWYSNNVQVSGGTADYTFNITSGALPPGFYIRQDDAKFYLEGIPNKTGTYTFSLKVTDRRNAYTERTFSVTIEGTETGGDEPVPANPVTITTNTIPNGKAGESYSATITATGDVSYGMTWVITGLPEGLSYTTSGGTCSISGTPQTAGTYTVNVNVANTQTEDSKSFTLTVEEPDIPVDPITITTDSLNYAVTGQSYTQTLTATGSPSSWSITDGELPAGLSLNSSTGEISGTVSDSAIDHNANAEKVYTFEVTAANESGGSAVKTFSINVSEPVKFITPATLTAATVGKSYEAEITVNGTIIHVMTWVITGLPDGLVYSANGRTCKISGTPTTAGTYTVKANTANIRTEDFRDFTLTVDPKPVPALKPQISLPKNYGIMVAGQKCGLQLSASGTAPITWSSGGSLPPGLTIDTSTGKISGTLEAADDGKYSHSSVPYSFTVSAANRAGTDTADMFISVWYPPEIVTDATLPEATVNTSYKQEITAEGTEFSMEWKKLSGSLPKGLTLTMSQSRRTCTITGSPTQAGTFTFTLRLSNLVALDNTTTTKTFTLTVKNPPDPETGKPAILTSSLPEGETGAAYVAVLDASGQKPITWSKSGSFPKGLKLDKYGTIIGVPTKPGAYTFTVKARNKSGTTSQKFTVNIAGETYTKPKITTKKIPEATVNQSYSVQLEGTGTSPVTWTFANTKYPVGLYITEDGHIAGIPKEAGKFSVKVRADNNIGSATKTFSLKVNGAAPSIVNEEISDATVKEDYSIQLLAEGSSPVTWSKSGAFPAGLKLNAKTGTITGSPKKAGSFTFKVTAKNKYGKDIRTFTMYVWPASSTASNPLTLQDMPLTEEYSQPETETGSSEIDLWVVSGDEELRGEIYAPEGRDITFMIGAWPDGFDEAEVYIADEAIAIEIADDGTFTLPGELVYDEFVIYVMAGNNKTIELYIVAEKEE